MIIWLTSWLCCVYKLNLFANDFITVIVRLYSYLKIIHHQQNLHIKQSDAIIRASYSQIGLHEVKLVFEILSLDVLLSVDIGVGENNGSCIQLIYIKLAVN